MKKMCCLFLIFWLPLFMPAAWAMGTHMVLDEAHINIVHLADKAPAHHCHSSKTSTPSQHNCSHCIYCSVTNASSSAKYFQPLFNLNLSQAHSVWTVIHYQSALLPNAYKPPILN